MPATNHTIKKAACKTARANDATAATQGAAAKGKSLGKWRTFDNAAGSVQIAPQSEAPESAAHHGAQPQESASQSNAQWLADYAANEEEAADDDGRPFYEGIPAEPPKKPPTPEEYEAHDASKRRALALEAVGERRPLPGAKGRAIGFPGSALPAVLSRWAMLEGKVGGFPPDLCLAPALIGMGATLAGSVCVRVGNGDGSRTTPLNLAGAGIARAGTGKSEASLRAFHWLSLARRAAIARYKDMEKEYAALPEKERKNAEPPKLGRLHYVDDYTLPKLMQQLNVEKNVLHYVQEIVGLHAELSRGGEDTGRGAYMKLLAGEHDLDTLEGRIGRGVTCVQGAVLSLWGESQKAKFLPMARGSLDGLTQRLSLLVWPDDEFLEPQDTAENEELLERARAELGEVWRVFLAAAPNPATGRPYTLGMEREAVGAYKAWREKTRKRAEMLGDAEANYAEHLGKYPRAFLSVCGEFCLIDAALARGSALWAPSTWNGDDAPRITLAHVEKAELFFTYLDSHARKVYDAAAHDAPELAYVAKLRTALEAGKLRGGETSEGWQLDMRAAYRLLGVTVSTLKKDILPAAAAYGDVDESGLLHPDFWPQ